MCGDLISDATEQFSKLVSVRKILFPTNWNIKDMDSNKNTQAIKTSVNVIWNGRSQDYIHPDDHTLPTYEMYSLPPSPYFLAPRFSTNWTSKEIDCNEIYCFDWGNLIQLHVKQSFAVLHSPGQSHFTYLENGWCLLLVPGSSVLYPLS